MTEVYIDGFDQGQFTSRSVVEALANLDPLAGVDTNARAIVTARRYSDKTMAVRLPDKLAGIIFRLKQDAGYLGYAIVPKDKHLRCRDLGEFISEGEAKQAIGDEYAKRDGQVQRM